MDHPPPGPLGPPSTGRDRLIWVAAPAPQRPRAAPERELLGGLDLDTMPASVTPPRTWRRAAAFSVAASAAVLTALSIVALAVVGPARLAYPLHREPGDAKVVVEPDTTRPGAAADGYPHDHLAVSTGTAHAVDQGGHGRYGSSGDLGRPADARGAAGTGQAGSVGWPASVTAAGAQPAEAGDAAEAAVTGVSAESSVAKPGGTESGAIEPGGATQAGLTPEHGTAPETGGTQHRLIREAGESVTSAARTIQDGHGFLVRLAGEQARQVPVAGIELSEPGNSTPVAGFEQSQSPSEAPSDPPDVPDTAISAESGVSHWISVDALGNAGRRQ
jgi:hypothetical protein